MDIQAEKLSLIEWIAKVDDDRIIKQFKALQQTSEASLSSLTEREKAAIDQGLKSIEEGKVHEHDAVMQSTKEKYPHLFK
ncbi:MAG: hypothetical protein CMB80_19180 [Flammeovirgaceae bacterium]|nr:hypothetical protein [Flammeovirgaceae bacterium]MBR07771.1 hypothetical protein [Rickettsiales bacterium]HCX23848.1 hypothetical protein [Cytophagales bacterium]|tara:strand:+ start:201 stop:440 length:240 start_codon:yes stop_codon:yes gene_type:complete